MPVFSDVDVEVPVGAVLPYAGPINTATRTRLENRGWLVCDGTPVSRAEYPELYSVIRRLYGYPPDKSSNAGIFCVPDYRGVFLRGLNRDASPAVDPEAEARTYANLNGTGNQGNQVGSRQTEAIQEHEHEYAAAYLSTSPPTPVSGPSPMGMIYSIPPPQPPPPPPSLTLVTGVTNTSETVVSKSSESQPDIVETRPVNAAINFIIKSRSRVRDPGPVGEWAGSDTQDTWPPPAPRDTKR
ncbi:MAG: tail fiber protein [Polyangiaceae bacterium]|nr:tail fiber protein [Polyangiaceae bacterium]